MTAKVSKRKSLMVEDVRQAAARATSHKGGTWSETEFNVGKYEIRESLKNRGATRRQLELYDKLVEAAPIIGGCFNRFSGD